MNADKRTYKVTLPDGTVDTRTTNHNYTHVIFFNFDGTGWGVNYSSSHKAAISKANYYKNCPAVQKGAKVEVEISPIRGEWTPCPDCGEYYCVLHEKHAADCECEPLN